MTFEITLSACLVLVFGKIRHASRTKWNCFCVSVWIYKCGVPLFIWEMRFYDRLEFKRLARHLILMNTFQMEEWYSIVRRLKDESEDPKLTREFCFRVYHDLMQLKPTDKKDFRDRKGPKFDGWATTLFEDGYSQELITAILSDDSFWKKTIEMTLS